MSSFGFECLQRRQISWRASLKKAKIAPYESRELEGFRDIHWGFSNVDDAIEFADSLLEFAALEDVTKLTVIG
jgi:hypothetical protein